VSTRFEPIQAVERTASQPTGRVTGGVRGGWQKGLVLQGGTFVVTLDALDKIRAGDITGGTHRVESLCFSSANVVYGDSIFRHGFSGGFIGKSMFDDLRHYRQTYRTNSVEWTPMEQSLEKHLASWK